MKHYLVCAFLAATVAGATHAQQSADHGAHHPASAPAAADMTDGEIRKIDKGAAKITIRHAEIRKLEMPPMTMVFRVKDVKLLDTVAEGDKVKFTAEQIDGNYVVTALVKAP